MNEEPKRPQRGPDVPQARCPDGARTRRGEDPLAELARLIGQEDPFASFEGGARPPAPRAPAGNGGDARVARREPLESRERVEPRRPAVPPRSYRDDHARPRREDESTPEDSARTARGAYAYSRDLRHDDGREPSRPASRLPRADAAHGTATLARPQPALARADRDSEIELPRESELPRMARRDSGRDGPDEQYKRTRATEYDPQYADEADLPEHGEEIFEDSQPRRSGRGLAVVAAVLGIAVVGTAGFFGYRALFGTGGTGSPPTIRAESGPVKVTPQANQAGETPGQKQIYERLGGPPPANERVVSREERPVDLNPGQRAVAPSVTVPVPPVQPPQQPAASAAVPTPASTEPKRVRTLTVRSDGTVINEQASRITPQRAAPAQPLAVNAYANQPAEEPENPAQNPRSARTPAAAQTPQQQANQPWAIVEPPVTRTARTNAAASVPAAGAFVVQVNSQKTEAEAQAAWRQMQSRYSTLLGNRQATIRRVDLGDRGVFYRAMLGPFASREQASEVCQSLKTAGGDCIVQRN